MGSMDAEELLRRYAAGERSFFTEIIEGDWECSKFCVRVKKVSQQSDLEIE
jgi:hypothetical protein